MLFVSFQCLNPVFEPVFSPIPLCGIFFLFFLLFQEYCMTEFLRMSGVYWGLTSMFLMNKQDMMEKDEIIEFVKSCHHDNGGFGASQYHDPHLLYTLSAIQVL